MKYIFLPGNSSHNKEWIDRLAGEFNQEKTVIHYRHWSSGDKDIDIDFETDRISKLNITEDCIAVCKSAGCYLSYTLQKRNILNIKKFVFIGFPYSWLEMKDINPVDMLKGIDTEVIIIQKSKDPAIQYEQLDRIIKENNIDARLIEYTREGEPEDNHSYEDTKYLRDIINNL
jgi:hypothetical protein